MSNLNELRPIQALSPFKRFCCTIGNLPSSYVESMSYMELVYWLCDYLKNTVIPTIDNNAQAVQELQNLYIELKKYVDNYFENLDVQDEINNKLDELVNNGTLERIINQNILGEVQNNIKKINNKTKILKQPMYAYLFTASRSFQELKTEIDNIKKLNFNGFSLQLYLTNTFENNFDINAVKQACQYIIDNNMTINHVKIFYPSQLEINETNITNYTNKVISLISLLNNYNFNNVYIFNERGEFANFTNKVTTLIDRIHSQNWLCGVSMNISSIKLIMQLNENILSLFDFYGFNFYPFLSASSSHFVPNELNKNVFESEEYTAIIYLINKFSKDKVGITETGIKDDYNFLIQPANSSDVYQINRTYGKTMMIFFDAIFEALNGNVSFISSWFATYFNNQEVLNYWSKMTGKEF